jgi:YebC/PmpR family DNA-binding regulatory protein
MNFTLRLAIEKARQANMPKVNIEKAIERGAIGRGGAQIEEIIYEAYGPSGTAILIEAATDNKNRASAEIKAALNKFGGKLAAPNAVQYLFEKHGVIHLGSENPDQTEEAIIESGAEDYEKNGSAFSVFTKIENLKSVQETLQNNEQKIISSEIVNEPKTTIDLDEKEAERAVKLLEALDILDDVSSVSSNLG